MNKQEFNEIYEKVFARHCSKDGEWWCKAGDNVGNIIKDAIRTTVRKLQRTHNKGK